VVVVATGFFSREKIVTDPFNQSVDLTSVDDLHNSEESMSPVESMDEGIEKLLTPAPPIEFRIMGPDSPMAVSREPWSYDIETYPDEPKPDVVVIDRQPLDKPVILKSIGSCKVFLAKGVHKDDVRELLLFEQASPKPIKGKMDALKKVLDKGDTVMQDWHNLSKSPFTCRIVSLSVCFYNNPEPLIWLAEDMENEAVLIQAWLSLVAQKRMRVGYNILSYDERCLLFRAMVHGLTAPHPVKLTRWGGEGVIDLAISMFGGVHDMWKLKRLLNTFGIHPPAGDTDGSMVKDMVEAGQWESLAIYSASDAWSEMELFKKMQLVMDLN